MIQVCGQIISQLVGTLLLRLRLLLDTAPTDYVLRTQGTSLSNKWVYTKPNKPNQPKTPPNANPTCKLLIKAGMFKKHYYGDPNRPPNPAPPRGQTNVMEPLLEKEKQWF